MVGKVKKARTVEIKAGFFRRLLALIADLLIITVVLFFPFNSILESYAVPSLAESMDTALDPLLFLAFLFMTLIALGYFMIFEKVQRQTLGMRLFHIEVSGNLSFWRLLVRNLFVIPFGPFYLLWVIEPLYLVFAKERLTEKLTRTSTVTRSIRP